MRKVILAMQMTLDGFIEGPNGEMGWMIQEDDKAWKDFFDQLRSVDTFLLGRVMYPGYADYWRKVLKNPLSPKNELEYARLAEKTQHIVFSKTLSAVDWENTRIVKGDLAEEVSQLKQQPGKDMMLWGGASLASSFINLNLIDEYRFVVQPVILGSGKSLFKDVHRRHTLTLTETKPLNDGMFSVHYQVGKK